MTQQTARALWITGSGRAECRETVWEVPADHVQVATLFTGISRGTERLILEGRVPAGEYATMRAPFQEGDFPFPVKYGYAAVGRIEEGSRRDEHVFALFPHQTRFSVPSASALTLPDGVSPERAVLAANMETALNIIWDAGVQPGDRVAVVGCGVVGALAGYIATRILGTETCLIDTDPARSGLAEALGCSFSGPMAARVEADVVIHASATAAGLATAVELAGMQATIVEASWYGSDMTDVPLGGRFHQRRLRIMGSQVGGIPPCHAPRWTFKRRLQKALTLLADPALDALISGETRFSDLPDAYGAILADPSTLCHRVRFDG